MTKIDIIGIAGGSGSCKTTFARKLHDALGEERCHVIGQDSYYFDQSAKFDKDGGCINYDHPSAIDFDLMAEHLEALKRGETVQVPIYDFATHSRLPETKAVSPARVILVDGILILSQPRVRKHFTESVFMEVPEELRFERRMKRDVAERGRTPEGVREQFFNQVKPMHDQFVEPSIVFAQHIVKGDEGFTWLLDYFTDAFSH